MTPEQAHRYRRLEDHQESYHRLCQQVEKAPWRQSYHIQPPAGLLNDPNGFCHDGLTYHLFYQWHPLDAVHGLKYWRYLQSNDLIHFQDQGIGIAPDSIYDNYGAYSGSALYENKHLLIAYTGNHRDTNYQRIPYQLLAEFDPETKTLKRHSPFLNGAPKGYSEHVRDPKIWREGKDLYAIIGAQRTNQTSALLLFKNNELQGEIELGLQNFGYMLECPDYFQIDDFDIITCCPQGLEASKERFHNIYQAGYFIGKWIRENNNFQHQGFQEIDYGFDFYAMQSCQNAQGERLMIAWLGLPDTHYPSDQDGWQGCLSLVRKLSIKNGKLYQSPVESIHKLRKHFLPQPKNLTQGEILIENPQNTPFCLHFFANEKQHTRLEFDGNTLYFDRRQSGALPEIIANKKTANKGDHLRQINIDVKHAQLFLDNSSVEIFINHGEITLSARLFPAQNANAIHFQSQSAQISAWQY